MGSILESAFTAPGTNARNGQQQRQKNAISVIENYLNAYGANAGAMGQRDLADEANARQAMMTVYNSFARQSDPNAQAGLFAGTARQAFNTASRQAAGMARGAGLDRATIAALAAGDPLQRARAESGARAMGRQQAMANQQNALQALTGILGLNSNRMSNLYNANSAIQNQAPVQVGPSPLAAIGALAGQFVPMIPTRGPSTGNKAK